MYLEKTRDYVHGATSGRSSLSSSVAAAQEEDGQYREISEATKIAALSLLKYVSNVETSPAFYAKFMGYCGSTILSNDALEVLNQIAGTL